MISWKLTDIAHAVGGELINPPQEELYVTSMNTDSREVAVGAIFAPIVAERNGQIGRASCRERVLDRV